MPGRSQSELVLHAEERFAVYLVQLDGVDPRSFDAWLADEPAELHDALKELASAWGRCASLLARAQPSDLGVGGLARAGLGSLVQRARGEEPASVASDAAGADASPTELLGRLALRAASFDRYRVEEEVGRGGMGEVRRVWDEDLRRHLVMKSLRSLHLHDPGKRARFLEEAQVTGQLDHPSIVPVHELGIDGSGGLYFTMKQVRGLTLAEVYQQHFAGDPEWSFARVVGIIQRVAEALAYAHDRGIVHRDLKPANVMVGRYGEVYLMDWGLARVLGRPERPADVPLGAEADLSTIHTERRDGGSTALVTADGTVLGTPVYMSPEQAHGDVEHLREPSDVYSLGAVLYHLLAGGPPYLAEDPELTHLDVWKLVKTRSPQDVQELAPQAQPELASICRKAMAREPVLRFESAQAMADELRAYLEHRVVRSHRTGVGVEVRKWVSRNRGVSAALVVLLLVLVGAGVVYLDREGARALARQQIIDGYQAKRLLATADQLGPIHPTTSKAYDAWLQQARELVEKRAAYEESLDRLNEKRSDASRVPDVRRRPHELEPRVSALEGQLAFLEGVKVDSPASPMMSNPLYARVVGAQLAIIDDEIEFTRGRLERESAELGRYRRWRFQEEAMELEYEPLWTLVQDLDRIERVWLEELESRASRALSLNVDPGSEANRLWGDTIAAIADKGRFPQYEGLQLGPQVGLVPLEPDEDSGLWEFWHVLSGERPRRDQSGKYVVEPDTGIVLVLIPGGAFSMGAQQANPDQPNYISDVLFELGKTDRLSAREGPVHEVRLEAYFLSKYELTQAQYRRLAGENPSVHYPIYSPKASDLPVTATHPVESISWLEGQRVLSTVGLDHPTEAQFERAARGWNGGQLPFRDPQDAIDRGLNFADWRYGEAGKKVVVNVDDGFPSHAPVDHGRPNEFGLYGMAGNIREWCLDWRDNAYPSNINKSTGEHLPLTRAAKAIRGGGYRSDLCDLRHSAVTLEHPSRTQPDIGLRAARPLK